jgi:hypothetical protein
MEDLEKRRIERYESLLTSMQQQLFMDVGNLISESAGRRNKEPNLANSSDKPGDAIGPLKPEKHTRPMSIKELFDLNGRKLPFIVMKTSWTDEYYYVIEEFEDNRIKSGHYIKRGDRWQTSSPPPLSDLKDFFLVKIDLGVTG